jgi:hypothetical protein
MLNSLADQVLLAAYAKNLRPVPTALVEFEAKEMASNSAGALLGSDDWEE